MPLMEKEHYTIEDIYALPEGERAEPVSYTHLADGLGQGTAEQLTALVDERLDRRRKSLAVRKENGLLAAGEEEREQRLFNVIRDCREAVRTGGATDAFSERSGQEQIRAEPVSYTHLDVYKRQA